MCRNAEENVVIERLGREPLCVLSQPHRVETFTSLGEVRQQLPAQDAQRVKQPSPTYYECWNTGKQGCGVGGFRVESDS